MHKLILLCLLACLCLLPAVMAVPLCFTSGTGANNHCYELVTTSSLVTWHEALAGAATKTLGDETGYLATVTSSQENAFISTFIPNLGTFVGAWLSGSDEGNEGTFTWRAGPENGQAFWTGGRPTLGGHCLTYCNWNNNNEPRGAEADEHFVEIWPFDNFRWNDQVRNPSGARNYVVEYTCNGPDTDGDGIPDSCDSDRDGDGILNNNDNCPLVPNPGQENTDGDTLGNACDVDDDNDGISDPSDNCPLVSNAGQEDNDGDGLGDACDNDDDNDGVLDNADNCPFIANPDQADVDQNGFGNACDNSPCTRCTMALMAALCAQNPGVTGC